MFDQKPNTDLIEEALRQNQSNANNKILIPVGQIKQINKQLSFVNNFTAFESIHAFLLDVVKKTNSDGELYPGQELSVLVEREVQPKKYTTINIDRVLAEAATNDLRLNIGETFSHLDLLRIITGIIRLLRQVDQSILGNWDVVADDDLWIIQEWLPKSDKFDEVELARTHGGKLLKLVEKVLEAAEIYNAKYAPVDYSNFIDSATQRDLFYQAFTEEILSKLPNYNKVSNWANHSKEHLSLTTEVIETLKKDEYFPQFFTATNLSALTALKLHSPQGTFSPQIIQHEWYSLTEQVELRKQLLETFISKYGDALSEKHIKPLLSAPTKPDAPVVEATTKTDDTEASSDTDTPGEQQQQLLPQDDFATLLLSQATPQLQQALLEQLLASNPRIATFHSTHASVVVNTIQSLITSTITNPTYFETFLEQNWERLASQHSRYFVSSIDPETLVQTHTVESIFAQQPTMVELIANFVAEQLPLIRTSIEPEIIKLVDSQDKPDDELETEVTTPPTPEPPAANQEGYFSRSDFIKLLSLTGYQNLFESVQLGLEVDPIIRAFARQDGDPLENWLELRVPIQLSKDFFTKFINDKWPNLTAQYMEYFQADPLSQGDNITYSVKAEFVDHQVILNKLTEFVGSNTSAIVNRLKPELLAYIAQLEQQDSDEPATPSEPPQPEQPAGTAVVAPPEPVLPTPDQTKLTALDPEAEAKLFFATRELLTTVMLNPLADQMGLSIDDLPPELAAEIRRAAENFLKDNPADLRLSAKNRLALIRKFSAHLRNVSHSPNSNQYWQLLRQDEKSIYNNLDTKLKTIADFDNHATTLILKQKIDALLLNANENTLQTIQLLDFSLTQDRSRFFLLLQLPPFSDATGGQITKELDVLLQIHHKKLGLILKNYLKTRAVELRLAAQEKDNTTKPAPTTEAAQLHAATQTALSHQLIQSLSSKSQFKDDGEAAEIVGSAIHKSKKENLTDRANWLLKQNQQQYGQIWRVLTQQQQLAVYEKIAQITGIPQYPPSNFDVAAGYPIPTGIGAVSIMEILTSIKQATHEELPAETQELVQDSVNKIAASENSDEFKQLLLTSQIQDQIVSDFLAQLDSDILAEMQQSMILGALDEADALQQLSSLYSYDELSSSAFATAENLDASSQPSGIFRRFRSSKPSTTKVKKVQKAAVKTLKNAESLVRTGKKLAQMTTPAGVAMAAAQFAYEFLKNPKEGLKKLGAILGVGLAGFAPLLFSAGARIGFFIGSAIGGAAAAVATFFGAGAFAVPLALTGAVGGTWGGLAVEQWGQNARNALLGTSPSTPPTTTASPVAAPAVGNVVTPKHVVQPRFAPNAATTQTAAAQAAQAQRIAQGATAAPVATTGVLATTTSALSTITALPVAILAPALTASLAVFLSFITVFIIFSAFLVPIPGGNDGYNSPLAGFEGCWPTTGAISQFKTHTDDEGVIRPHATITNGVGIVVDASGTKKTFSGRGTAVDIAYRPDLDSVAEIYAPFSGFASFYPQGHGLDGGAEYGNHITIATPSFVIVLAHLDKFSSNIPTVGPYHKVVVAGEPLGIMGSSGIVTGRHLHYEVVGVDILQVLPLSPADKAKYDADERSMVTLPVSAKDCASPTQSNGGFLAIGPASVANIRVSNSYEISTVLTTTCSWKNSSEVQVAVNANFYNTPYTPIGIAGRNPARYYANADDRPIDFIKQLQSLVLTTDSVQIIRPDPTLSTSPTFPVPLPLYTQGVTGIYVAPYPNQPPDTELDERTALGYGISNGTCESVYQGQQVLFLAVMPQATYTQIEQELARCGATQFIHFDGGSSSAFCSDKLSFDPNKVVPVHVGLYKAEISRIGGGVGTPTTASPAASPQTP